MEYTIPENLIESRKNFSIFNFLIESKYKKNLT